ncbi:hypothetical protein COB55_03125 [Candidatus Wolfebacteria bacterium]|nr:MAG: hypothetical protein COB55_03125 [Candidatus Wolfebacteria bacterium]
MLNKLYFQLPSQEHVSLEFISKKQKEEVVDLLHQSGVNRNMNGDYLISILGFKWIKQTTDYKGR